MTPHPSNNTFSGPQAANPADLMNPLTAGMVLAVHTNLQCLLEHVITSRLGLQCEDESTVNLLSFGWGSLLGVVVTSVACSIVAGALLQGRRLMARTSHGGETSKLWNSATMVHAIGNVRLQTAFSRWRDVLHAELASLIGRRLGASRQRRVERIMLQSESFALAFNSHGKLCSPREEASGQAGAPPPCRSMMATRKEVLSTSVKRLLRR